MSQPGTLGRNEETSRIYAYDTSRNSCPRAELGLDSRSRSRPVESISLKFRRFTRVVGLCSSLDLG